MRILLVSLVLSLAACTSAPPTTPRAPEIPQFSTTTPKPRAERTLPDSCAKVLTREDLDATVATVITGRTEVVAGVALPKIGRTGRIDCYYGIPQGQPTTAAVLTVGMAAYTDSASAAQRIQDTVNTERDNGIAPREIQVGLDKGFLLDGATRTVVVAHGKITVAVSVKPELATGEQVAALADLALTAR
ncbi:hypothetical protein [Actinokineospora diospyrosa]|uniref:DUF3558 domain-containing protein n=1 Tax=Actinokineospora diospyrosa TaxID=103728 RepID=A0ABT1I6G0_9PSEU|nr:hypothetical protein [Actinokineospora diospyrosa]MCP2268208.1 hypothetical protein [Actinokineospora diospyrosa]